MPGPIHLYVSSSPELAAEREAIGQVVAELPMTIGWRIGHSLLSGQAGPATATEIARIDLFVLVLGHDFAAPMGAELLQAAAGRQVLAFRKACSYSPSAQDAARKRELDWHVFADASEFRPLFSQTLLHTVLRRATELGLELAEIERLTRLSQDADGRETGAPTELDRREAGHGGVILGREIWQGEQ